MYSLVDVIKEAALRVNGIHRKKFRLNKFLRTDSKWVDLLEIEGSGVVDYLRLACISTYSSDVKFRVEFDDIVWEWDCRAVKDRSIFGGDGVLGVASNLTVAIPDLEDNDVTAIDSQYVHFISTDSTANDIKGYSLLPGGIKFNKRFKLSTMNSGYEMTASALYGIYQ